MLRKVILISLALTLVSFGLFIREPVTWEGGIVTVIAGFVFYALL